jgi:hypothetical protein
MTRTITRHLSLASTLLALALLDPLPALAEEVESDQLTQSPSARLELRADLQNLFLYRNDADFDRTAPYYDASGQSVGALATILTPSATFNITDSLRLFYQVELGLNYWSKQNPDQQDPQAPDVFVLKHREIYGEGELLDDTLGFKLGYAYFRDPTGLFVAHWMGIAQTWISWASGSRAGLFVGQVPDQTYEGIVVTEHNFKRDIWVFGGRTELPLTERLRLSAAVTSLLDTHIVGQTRWIVSPAARLELTGERLSGSVGAALQTGQLEHQAVDGTDQTVVAWAAQARLRLDLSPLSLTGSLLLLSPDDAHDGNGFSHAFLYSGKSTSSTLLLTEDETRDWYDNLDERISSFRGGFFCNRAGLFVGDVRATLDLWRWLSPSLIVGAATVLKPENALDSTLVGVEADLLLEATITDYLHAHVVIGGFFPGSAGGALINQISRDATDPIVMTEVSLTLQY